MLGTKIYQFSYRNSLMDSHLLIKSTSAFFRKIFDNKPELLLGEKDFISILIPMARSRVRNQIF
jgi:hypothetical protein